MKTNLFIFSINLFYHAITHEIMHAAPFVFTTRFWAVRC